MSKVMNVYACGGAGVNTVGRALPLFKNSMIGMCEFTPAFIDTSMSNICHFDIDDKLTYLFEGIDGSGKLRSMNYQTVAEKSKEILSNFKPSDDINLIIHSASGGSGSVIGPVLAAEMLNKNKPFILLVIGSSGSRIEINNTIKCLKGYEILADKNDRPVIIHYLENNQSNLRGQTDKDALTFMSLVSVLFSGTHKELDSADLKNFMDYTTVTSYPSKLISTDFYLNDVILEKSEKAYTMATIAKDRHESSVMVDYHAVGYMTDEVKEGFVHELPLHCAVIDGRIQRVMDNLQAIEKEFAEQTDIGRSKKIVDKNDSQNANDNCIIL